MAIWILLIALSMPPLDGATEDQVDELELNHYYDGDGKLILQQWILWEWVEDKRRVVAWRLVNDTKPYSLSRRFGGGWQMTFDDLGRGLRRVRAKCYCETWTQHDPEVADRSAWPSDRRRGLTPFDDPRWQPKDEVKPEPAIGGR